MPPVSKRTPGGRAIVAGRVVDLEARASSPPGSGAPGCRGGASASAAPSGAPGTPGPRGDVAGGLDLPDQGRVDQAAAALGGASRPALTAVRSSSEAGTRSRGSAFSAHSSLSGLKRDSVASNSTMNWLRLLGRRRGRSHPGPGSPISSRTWLPIASKMTSCSAHGQEALVVTGAEPARRSSAVTGAAAGDAVAAGGRDDRGDDAALEHLAHHDRARCRRLAGAELVGEEREQHREEDDRAPDHQRGPGPARGERAQSLAAPALVVAALAATAGAAAAAAARW